MVIDVARAMASRNLLTLRAELDEQTKGIQKLQKEVEQATQHTINQLSFSIHEKCHKNTANDSNAISRISHASSSATGNHNALSSVSLQSLKRHLHAGQTIHGDGGLTTQCSAMQNGLDGTTCLIDRNPAKTSLNELSSFFINSHRRPEAITQGHHRHSLNQPINELNLTVQELIKKNAEMDIRCNESKGQDEVNRKLQDKIQELETANGVQEEMLKQAHAYIDILKEMLQKRDYVHQDLQGTILTYIKASGKEIIPTCDLSNLGTFVVKILQEQADDASALKTKLQTNEDQLSFLEKELEDKENSLKQCQERCDHFAKKYEQEMAAMSHEMNTATSHAETMQNQIETFQQQNTELKNHIANLESVVSEQRSEVRSCKRNCKDKVEELNKQLFLANTALEKAQNEHTLLTQDYDKQLQELNQLQEAHKVCEKQLHLERDYNWQLQEGVNVSKLTNDHLRRELLERSMEVERLQRMVKEVKEESQQKEEEKLKTIQDMTANASVITCQLETMKATLQKMTEELAVKTQSLKNAEKNLNESKVHLAGKEEALKNAVDELRKLRMYAEAKKKELLQLKATSEQMSEMLEDTETLKLLLVEKDNMIKTLRNQIQTLSRVVEQQNQKVESLEAEKFQLLEEVFLNNAFIQETKVVAEKKDMRIHELEEICRLLNMEKSKLTNECIEKTCAANKLRKERKEIVAELRETQHELACLSEDYEILKRNTRNQTGDTENATAILKMQLKAAIAELAQTKNTMKTVENCDGHAIKIATRMQKKITAKREQIDTLQTRIQFLEEALSNATKDTQHLKLGKTKLLQKCAIQAAEKIKLCDVAEILKSENIALKGNVLNTEATLDKTLLQLSECQAVIQRLEQEITLLRLQHTLDLKELRGPFSSEISAKATRQVASKSFLQCCDVPPSGNFNMVEPSEEAINLSDGLPCAPFKDEALLKLSRKADHTSGHISKEPLTLHTTDLEDNVCSLSLISSENHITVSPCYTSSLKKHYKSPKNRPRSPVYSLLTAPTSETDICDTMDRKLFLETVDADNFVHGEQHNELTDSTCQILQYRLEYLQTIAEDLQMKNKEMSLMIGNHENQC
ncbi:coiled-coil domain-containing protein 158 isoform X2 [Rana temporaria]|uniref:coiled-coil domain-containing protein 158 isoform X2 n=1 Tax=Rana temporaria TaxID=8407 RepID=UPI001AAD9FFA|nr:coiled-coil domain-containing protein 158 isoform X2 [Rana temporaria]